MELSQLSQLIQEKKNVDSELWDFFGQSPKHPDTIFRSSERKLLIVALCSLLTTSIQYSISAIKDAVVTCGSNPKLAYTALTYFRLRVRPLSTYQDVAFDLLMMLDAAHLAKSPVNRLPSDLFFTTDQTKALAERFAGVQWQQLPAAGNSAAPAASIDSILPLLRGKNYHLVATVDAAILADLARQKMTPPFKLLFLCAQRDTTALPLLRKSRDWLLIAHCVSLWFNTDAFLECPISYQFEEHWTQLINLWVPLLAKTDQFSVFEQPPNGLLVLWSFFTLVRPSKIPQFELKDNNTKVWGELFGYVFNEQMEDSEYVKSNLHLLAQRGKLVALDMLMRVDRDPELPRQFSLLFKDGLVDPEPVLALMLQRGWVVYAAKTQAGAQNVAPTSLSMPQNIDNHQLLRVICDTPVATIKPLITAFLARFASSPATKIRLLENTLPLISTLSIRGNGTMVKLEYTCLLFHALLMSLYRYIGFNDGVTQMVQAGLARAEGLGAVVWKSLFSSGSFVLPGSNLQLEDLERFVQEIGGLPLVGDPPEIRDASNSLLSHTRTNVLLTTINDTVLELPGFCGFKRKQARRKYDPHKVVSSWSHLADPMSASGLCKNSQLVLDLAPAVSFLGTSPEPWFSRAAENLRSPVLHYLSDGYEHTPLQVKPGQIVTSLNLSNEKTQLIVTRALSHNSSSSSITVRIPIDRPGVFEDLLESISLLIKKSTTLSRNQFQGSTDEWWRQQKRFGKQTKEYLKQLERLLRGMVSLFSSLSFLGTRTLATARDEILKVYARYVPAVPRKVLNGIRDEIIDMFLEVLKQRTLGVKPDLAFCKLLVSDLNGLVLDALRLLGYAIDYDMIDLVELEHGLLTLACSLGIDDKDPPPSESHFVLIPDSSIVSIPWESLPYFDNHTSTSRCLSYWHYNQLARADATPSDQEDTDADTDSEDEPSIPLGTNVYYVLNPHNDIPSAQEIFTPELAQWRGVIGKEPGERELISHLKSSSCYIYIGHGSGHRLIRASSIRKLERCSAVMLFGCSSAKISDGGSGPVMDYTLGGCKLFLGFMWDVPNTDCNLFTFEFLRLCFEEGHSVFRALKLARRVCRIYTTSLAAVVYGIP